MNMSSEELEQLSSNTIRTLSIDALCAIRAPWNADGVMSPTYLVESTNGPHPNKA
jgi:hypothetical protein